jgi:hypothetical protein
MATNHETYTLAKLGSVDLIHSPSGATVYLDGAYKGVVLKHGIGWTYKNARFNNYANVRQAAYDLMVDAPKIPEYAFNFVLDT